MTEDDQRLSALEVALVKEVEEKMSDIAATWERAFHAAAKAGDLAAVRRLSDDHSVLQHWNRHHADPWADALPWAIDAGHADVVRFLIARTPHHADWALSRAVKRLQDDIAVVLIEAGATVWIAECIWMLHAHPDAIEDLYRGGKVTHSLFTKYGFDERIARYDATLALLERTLYDDHDFPRVLAKLVCEYA